MEIHIKNVSLCRQTKNKRTTNAVQTKVVHSEQANRRSNQIHGFQFLLIKHINKVLETIRIKHSE